MGRQGSEEGQFEEPRDIAVDSNGNVLVTDTRRNTLLIFDKNGNFIRVCNMYLDRNTFSGNSISLDLFFINRKRG